MITIKVDRSVCQGYGNCVLADPDTFELDDDDLVSLKVAQVDSSKADAVRRAAYDCPTDAIRLDESTGT